jgi:hypothetical protein
VVTAVDVERQTLTLERPDKRQLTLDTTHYDAVDRGTRSPQDELPARNAPLA